jgi:short-subunit dehydrogenase
MKHERRRPKQLFCSSLTVLGDSVVKKFMGANTTIIMAQRRSLAKRPTKEICPQHAGCRSARGKNRNLARCQKWDTTIALDLAGLSKIQTDSILGREAKMRFANRTVIVTGASSGIGWDLAKEASRERAKVGVIARREENLQRLVEEIRSTGGTAEYQAIDVSQRDAVLHAVETLRQKLGPIDVMIANAGVGDTNPPESLNMPQAKKVIEVNLLGVMYSIEAVLPEMLQRNSGQQIAVISSLASYKGIPSAAAYCASKSAVNAYVESLRIQLYDKKIYFSTICPGFIRTPMTTNNQGMFWVYDSDVAARKILKAIYRRKKVYNFPWITTRLMKLTTWLPDWILHRTMPKQVGGQGAEKG